MALAEEELSFECYFDALGKETSKSHHAIFDIVDETDYTLTMYIGNKSIANPTDLDFQRYKIHPLVGYLQDANTTYSKAKLVFIKRNQINSTFGDVIKEICYTDNGGRYLAYIDNGTYDIEIHINNKKIVKRNVEIKDGIRTTFSLFVSGLIKKKKKDTVEFCGCDYKDIHGQLIDAKGTPIDNGEIMLIQNDEIKAYVRTDDDGWYRFAVKNGEYLLKIRGDNAPLKQTNITIDDRNNFCEQITAQSILFSKKAMIYL